MNRAVFYLLLSLCTVIGASAQDFSERYPAYQLERSDVLEVKFRYTPEFDQTVAVGPDGYVSLAGLPSFVAAGLTVDQFRDKVVVLSSAKLVKPVVTVVLKEFERPHVYVEGEVNTPGRVDFRSDISINDAIAMAGGFKNSAKQSQVLLLHRIDAKHSATRVIDVKKLVDKRQLEETVVLSPGDVVYVPQNGLSKVERLAHLGQFGALYPLP
jgi:polysaccharide export outer membrane protein